MKKIKARVIGIIIAAALIAGGAITIAEGVRTQEPEAAPVAYLNNLSPKLWET